MSTQMTLEEKAAKYDEQKAKQTADARFYQKVRTRMLKNWRQDDYPTYQAHRAKAMADIRAEDASPA